MPHLRFIFPARIIWICYNDNKDQKGKSVFSRETFYGQSNQRSNTNKTGKVKQRKSIYCIINVLHATIYYQAVGRKQWMDP